LVISSKKIKLFSAGLSTIPQKEREDFASKLKSDPAEAAWYASLLVVVEGYRELKLSDSSIDALLSEDHVEFLDATATEHFILRKAITIKDLLNFYRAVSLLVRLGSYRRLFLISSSRS
jgi:hypothetical protein